MRLCPTHLFLPYFTISKVRYLSCADFSDYSQRNKKGFELGADRGVNNNNNITLWMSYLKILLMKGGGGSIINVGCII